MCGIVGISAEKNVAEDIYEALLMLQHRGQDAAGMVVCEPSGKLNSRKSMGYVRDVFRQRHMSALSGKYGIGHVRYPTAGGAGKEFAQPMYVNTPYGISLAHNGNLTNSTTLIPIPKFYLIYLHWNFLNKMQFTRKQKISLLPYKRHI